MRTSHRKLLLVSSLLLAAWPIASALGFQDTYQTAEQLNGAGTPLATSYTRTDSNVGAGGTPYFCNSIFYTDDVWYQIHPHAAGVVSFQASSNAFLPVVTMWAVNNGALGSLPNGTTPCNTASPATRTASVTGVVVEAGKTYDLQLGIQCVGDCSTQQTGGTYTFGLTYDPDSDGDGVYDSIDACKTDPGPAANHGCPPDGDHDGVPDAKDRCPTRAGSPTARGCPVLGALIGQNFASRTFVREIYVTNVVGRTTLRAFCHGDGCFPERRIHVRRKKRKVVLIRNKSLRAGDVITVTATAPGTIGKYRQLKIGHRGGAPRVGDILCLQPGSGKPSRCPS
jgi:thrombospondin type 3 repeat protein